MAYALGYQPEPRWCAFKHQGCRGHFVRWRTRFGVKRWRLFLLLGDGHAVQIDDDTPRAQAVVNKALEGE